MSGAPRLFLIFTADQAGRIGPAMSGGSEIVTAAFAACLNDSDVASALILTKGWDTQTGWQDGLKRAVSRLQSRNIAVLLDDLSLVGLSGADGVHIPLEFDSMRDELTTDAQLQEIQALLMPAIKALKPNGLVGAGGLHSRHAAMSAAEMDVDYVMFGEPGNDGWIPPFDAVMERTSWWTPIFTIPCVAYAPDIKSVGALAETGAEFVALNAALLQSEGSAQSLIDQAVQALRTNSPC